MAGHTYLRWLERAVRQARGIEPADLVVRGATILDVVTGELRRADIAICGERIVGLGDYRGREEIDASGLVAIPGLIDAHVHIESSMLAPEVFAAAVAARGTTAVVADPHEIANVAGLDGVRYMIEAGRRAPIDIFIMAPSCVPATHMETAGAELGPEEVTELFGEPGVIGLAEMMNFPGVVSGDEGVLAKLAAAHGRVIDGHSPGLRGADLQAYIAAGPRSDHECVELAEAREKLAAGMWVMVREGGAARNLAELAPLLAGDAAWRCMLVTDDCNARHLAEHGHIDWVLARAVREGIQAHVAVRAATLNPATYFRLHDRGLLAPGMRADITLVEDLQAFRARLTIKDGRVIARDGQVVDPPRPQAPERLRSTCHLPDLSPDNFALRCPDAAAAAVRCRVIEVVPGQIITRAAEVELPCRDGRVAIEQVEDLCLAAVVHRHGRGGGIGVGLVRGFGLRDGALASTVAHDSHNLVLVGRSAEDMVAAARAVAQMGGGQAAVRQGETLAAVPLPVGGLMSDRSLDEVAREVARTEQAARELGCSLPDPFMTLSFIALPVIPELRLTDLGLVDVAAFDFVPVVLEQ